MDEARDVSGARVGRNDPLAGRVLSSEVTTMKYCPNPNCPFRRETDDIAEYEDTATTCSDCDSALVAEKPVFSAPADPSWDEMVAIMHVAEPGLAPVIKSILDGAEIRYVIHGENVQDLFGVGRIGPGFNPIAGQPTLFVESSRAEQARALLAESTPTDSDAN